MTPVILFVFNRPDKTSRVISALRNQTVRPSKLLVFADGARNSADEPNVSEVRNLVHSMNWADVHMIERPYNFGCAQNIIQGLTEAFQSHNRASVLEDDTLPAVHWYESICLLLDHYANDTTVFSVGGYPSIKADALPNYQYDVILSPRFSCWGWGTWADRWHDILRDLRDFRNPFGSPDDVPLHAGFDLRGGARVVEERPGFYWDIPIALLCLHRGLLHALTRYYLVQNIGTDSGTHGGHLPQAVLRFMEENNRVEEKLPDTLPPVRLQDSVCKAVQNYIIEATCSSVTQETRQKKTDPFVSAVRKLVRLVRHRYDQSPS